MKNTNKHLNINCFDVLTRKKLELIVKANLNANGIVEIPQYSVIKKPELLLKIKELPDLIIPMEFISN